jgi:gamma-glutamyltranspeptidase/glutathione hydrolase
MMVIKLISFFILFFLFSCAHTHQQPIQSASISIAPREQVEAFGKKWIISTQGKHTTEIARTVMKSGGTLIDAAIAASFAISVERPHSTGIGGGGFLIYYEAKTGKSHVFDFRERAPLASKRDMFLDSKGEVVPDLSVYGALSVGTPGLVKGLSHIHKKFGKKSWKSLIDPAVALAKNGFEIYPSLSRALLEEQVTLNRFPSSKKIFAHADGSVKKLGEILRQEDLAQTLELISKNPDDFYQGKIASMIVSGVQKEQGLLTAQDLKRYVVKERKAIRGHWKNFEIVTMPPPSSGGIHVLQILKLLEKDSLNFLDFRTIHLTASAMQSAFADRAVFLGDPDFVKVPRQGLLNSTYLRGRRAEFNETRARSKAQVFAGSPSDFEEETNTTHFSMMDIHGNVVVSTQTINGFFGSGFVADGTGIVLNNEMDDFSAKQGKANIFGAIGGDANSVAPLKTPLSSMSPTIVLKKGVPILALGAPGGTRIITAVAQTILNHLEYKKDLYHSIAAARIHQQWSPDVLSIEKNSNSHPRDEISPQTISILEKMGWVIKRESAQSNVMAVSRESANNSSVLIGVSDPRDSGTSAGE